MAYFHSRHKVIIFYMNDSYIQQVLMLLKLLIKIIIINYIKIVIKAIQSKMKQRWTTGHTCQAILDSVLNLIFLLTDLSLHSSYTLIISFSLIWFYFYTCKEYYKQSLKPVFIARVAFNSVWINSNSKCKCPHDCHRISRHVISRKQHYG